MKIPKVFPALILACLFVTTEAQIRTVPVEKELYSPEGILDHVFDRFGKHYSLADIRIDRSSGPSADKTSSAPVTTCSAGYFNLYFEAGSGMDGSSPIEISRRNVVCQVFSDIALFIASPLSTTGDRVNIFIRDIGNMGLVTPATSNVLGLGSCFFCVPMMPNVGGIADNLIWQTIVSGKDAYSHIASPLLAPAIGSGYFYHGMLGINFFNPSNNWSTQLTSAPSSSQLDLYTTVLHEAAHAMGFLTLINDNGKSKFGANFPYYGRYDTHLQSQNGTPLLTQTTACANSRYGWYWNNALSTNILQPGFTNTNSCLADQTVCNSAIKYVSGSLIQPVYTPNCYDPGGTLSHFEDQCAPAVPGNNLYFVMSNATANGPAYTKRYFKPEERQALCDMGYSCGSSFGSTSTLNSFTYSGGACPGAQVAGINDGLGANGVYTFIGNTNAVIPLNNLLANDRFTSTTGNTFKCLEVVIGSGNISATSGTSSNFTPLIQGLHLLRYIPVDGATGKEGNITYVFVFATSDNCVPNTCNMVNNYGFETGNSCGQFNTQANAAINCWYPVTNYPTYYTRTCNSINYKIPTNPGWYCNPPCDTWNGPTGNNAMLYLANSGWSDGMATPLSSNLMPNITYTISFWAKVLDLSSQNLDFNLVFAAGNSLLPWTMGNNIPTSLPASLTQLSTVFVPKNSPWLYFSFPVTFNGSSPLGYLYIFNAGWVNPNGGTGFRSIFIDDVTLSYPGSGASFTQPPPINVCKNKAINNLATLVSVPGGTFSGNGVTYNATNASYNFNSGANLPVGTYPVIYTYSANGCKRTVGQNFIIQCGLAISPSSQTLCSGQSAVLNASCANTYTWSTGAHTSTITVSPSVTTIYTVSTDSTNGCVASQTVELIVTTCTREQLNPLNDLKIYPNPATEKLFIETGVETRITLYDLQGRVLVSELLGVGSHTLDLSGYSAGSYLLRYSDHLSGTKEMKVIKLQ